MISVRIVPATVISWAVMVLFLGIVVTELDPRARCTTSHLLRCSYTAACISCELATRRRCRQ